MIKKIIIILLSFFVFSIVWAQNNGYKIVNLKLDGNKVSQSMLDLNAIDVNFCNKAGEKKIFYQISPGEKQKICYVISNFSDQDLDVHISFVDATVTNDQWKNDACKQEGENQLFGQYVTGYQSLIHLPARSEIQNFATLVFPTTYTGNYRGCLTYYLGTTQMSGEIGFTVLMRKAKFIDVFVDSKVTQAKENTYFLWMVIACVFVIWVFFKKISKVKMQTKNK